MIPCRRENRSRSPYRILSPLFKISTGSKCFVALILPRLYSDNVFTGGWSLLACASLRVRRKRDLILPYPPSCLPFARKKKGMQLFFSFFINKWTERRMERRMFAFFFDSINKDDFVYGVRSLARRLRDRCCLRIIQE